MAVGTGEPRQHHELTPPNRVHRTFPCDPRSVTAARRFVAEACKGRADAEDVALLVSELATNAVMHARTPFEVTVVPIGVGGVRVEVADGSSSPPRLGDDGGPWTSGRGGGGRGLVMLDAIASRWGVAPSDSGKRVWFELAGPLTGARPRARSI